MPQDSVSRASALLDSVVDSIQAPRSKLNELKTDVDVIGNSSVEPEPSSATRRKNALARALFGASDSDLSLTSPSPPPPDEPNTGSSALPAERPPLIENSTTSSRSLRETLSPSSPSVNGALTSSSSGTEPLDKQEKLAREVQRRAEAAMADLNRMPSNAKANDVSQRKRVEVSQISGPRLVSASTSVDTIPVRSPSSASGHLSATQNQSQNPSKLGTRFRKFRGSLRASKPMFPGSDESTQHSLDQSSANTDRSQAGTPDGPAPFSATDASGPKVVSPSVTAASAGPGLKGFVSRFLKPRSGETLEPDRRKPLHSSSPSLITPSYFAQQQSERHTQMRVSRTVQSAPAAENQSFRPHTPVSPEPVPSINTNPPPPTSAPPASLTVPDSSATRAVDENALKQFLDAANNLGLDQNALTEFLARSPSMSSKLTTQDSKHLSTPSGAKSGQEKGDFSLSETTPLSATDAGPRRNPQGPSGEVIGKAPVRRPLARNATTLDSTNSTVVRRTLIFPSEAKQSTLEPGTGLRKSSSTRRRRSTSAASMHSNRSLHDRVPTPPPPKSPTGRRFSAEQSPPMPLIPSSLMAQTEAINAPQSAPAVPLEKSNSAYDSL